MRLFTSLFSRQPRKNQGQIAGRAAAVIDHVIYDVGIDALINGTFVLDKSFRLRFIGGRTVRGDDILATVLIGQLQEADIFRALGNSVAIDVTTLKTHIDCLVFGVMRELRVQSAALRALPEAEH
jgi:hypothetical protein